MLFTVEDVGFGCLRAAILDEHFFYEVLDFLDCGAAVFAKTVFEFGYHLVAYSLGLLAVFSAHSFGGFPNGVCYAFLIERF